jgi:hypothetical protein
MSAHPSRRAQEHRLPACVSAERRLRNSSLFVAQFFAIFELLTFRIVQLREDLLQQAQSAVDEALARNMFKSLLINRNKDERRYDVDRKNSS